MTMHYHGTPITPRSVLSTLTGRNFCVSYAAPGDVEWCAEHGQSLMLDNGAFSFWRQRKPVDWDGYYAWVDRYLDSRTTWAVIPDVIGGGPLENDLLLAKWPFKDGGAPVWHMDEPITRLLRLTVEYPRVCVGSAGDYELRTPAWYSRMDDAFDALLPVGGSPYCDLHMLRGMSLSGGRWPFTSVDSTDVGRNHNRRQNTASEMVARWDGIQCPATWTPTGRIALPLEEAA